MDVMKKTSKSTGFVYGHFWVGGEGAYAAKRLIGDTVDNILEQATEGLDGSLDVGMGFESLIGAILCIETITSIDIDGDEFTRSEYTTEFVGKLTEKQQEFLMELL